MKNKVLWGAGNNAVGFLDEHAKFVPSFIIDSAPHKNNTNLRTYKIINPSHVDCWEELFIVVTVDRCAEIIQFIEEKGLLHGRDYILHSEYIEKSTLDETEQEIERFIEQISNSNFSGYEVVFSHFFYDSPSREMATFWNKVCKTRRPLVLFWDAYNPVNKEILKKAEFPVFIMPGVLRNFEKFAKSIEDEIIPEKIVASVEAKQYLKWVAENIRLRYLDISRNAEYVIAYYADIIINKILDLLTPERVYIFNSFRAWHFALKAICDKKKIEVGCFEFGPLEGTYQLDFCGLMGESMPCMDAERFNQKIVTESDIEDTEKILDYMYETEINRYRQPNADVNEFFSNTFSKNKPIVLYAGQNDFESGLQPRTDDVEARHSPIFSGSMETAVYLWNLCKKNHLDFVYKPHPSMVVRADKFGLWTDSMPVLRFGDINKAIDCADIVITINSSIAYIALIRKKPTILLGYMQLSHNNACYEAYNREGIEQSLLCAAKNGITGTQKKNFVVHVARMLKYYLYDTLMPRELRYGRNDGRLLRD